MATPLYWKSWEIANIFYDTILRYPMIIKMDTEKQKFILETKLRKLVPLCTSFLLIILLSIAFIFVIIEVLLFNSTIISRPMVVCYLLITVGLVVIISTAIRCLPYLETVACQYYCSMLTFDKQIRTSQPITTRLPYMKLLTKGLRVKICKKDYFFEYVSKTFNNFFLQKYKRCRKDYHMTTLE